MVCCGSRLVVVLYLFLFRLNCDLLFLVLLFSCFEGCDLGGSFAKSYLLSLGTLPEKGRVSVI